MRFLLLTLLISSPVFACKMSPEIANMKAQEAALAAAAGNVGHKNLKARKEGKFWMVRTTKLDCVDYRIEVDQGKGDCKMTGKIIWMHPCQ